MGNIDIPRQAVTFSKGAAPIQMNRHRGATAARPRSYSPAVYTQVLHLKYYRKHQTQHVQGQQRQDFVYGKQHFFCADNTIFFEYLTQIFMDKLHSNGFKESEYF